MHMLQQLWKKNLYFSNSESNQMGKGNTKPPNRPPKQTNTYQKEFLAEKRVDISWKQVQLSFFLQISGK